MRWSEAFMSTKRCYVKLLNLNADGVLSLQYDTPIVNIEYPNRSQHRVKKICLRKTMRQVIIGREM